MERVHQAILDGDLTALRHEIKKDPKCLGASSNSGRTPLQLALAAGHYSACAAIVRQAPARLYEIPLSAAALLEQLIGEFSRNTLCSSWNHRIEFDLWALVIGDAGYARPYDEYLQVDRDDLIDVGSIADLAGGWFYHPEGADRPRFVDRAEWLALYERLKHA